jgi:hypothetical protein
MPVLRSCPDPNCPPTATAPEDVPEAGEQAGAEAEARFTTDEVARLSMFRLAPSTSGTRKAQGLRVIRHTRRAITEGATWSGGWRSKGYSWLLAKAIAVGPYRLGGFTTVEG